MKHRFGFLVMMAFFFACSPKQNDNKISSGPQEVKVTTTTVKTVQGSSDLHYSGSVEPIQTIPLTFQSSGIVEKVLVEEGDAVRKGQLLATVEKGDNESMYAASLAKYNQAKDAYDRLKSVHDNGSLPEIKWVEMETNLQQAASQMNIARSGLEKCSMRAPENGLIGNRNVEPGQSAFSATTPIELVKIDKVLVKVSVPENEISSIRKGQKALLIVSALEDKSFEGEISHIGVVADKISRTYDVKMTVNNPHLELKPGMVCDVVIQTGQKPVVTVVSYDAVSKDVNGNAFVYLVSKDGKSVIKQNIKVGKYVGKGVEVLSGLSSGECIVNEGKEKLSDHSLIRL